MRTVDDAGDLIFADFLGQFFGFCPTERGAVFSRLLLVLLFLKGFLGAVEGDNLGHNRCILWLFAEGAEAYNFCASFAILTGCFARLKYPFEELRILGIGVKIVRRIIVG